MSDEPSNPVRELLEPVRLGTEVQVAIDQVLRVILTGRVESPIVPACEIAVGERHQRQPVDHDRHRALLLGEPARQSFTWS
jgi:hypothetical protein